MSNKIMRTTGYNFDGYYIDEYIDVISEEVIFQNSLFKQISASIKDFIGSFSIFDSEIKGSSQLIENGKKYVLDRFTDKAKALGGNAILGIQFESSFGIDIIRIAISGTVVRISPNTEKLSVFKKNIPVKNVNRAPIGISAILCKIIEDNCFVSLEIYNPKNKEITGIKCDIVFHTCFDEIEILKDQTFTNFDDQENNHYISEPVVCSISKDFIRLLSYADIMIKKCIIGNSVTEVAYSEINTKEDLIVFENNIPTDFDALETFEVIQTLKNAKEIYEYLSKLYEGTPDSIPLEWMDEIRNLVNIERYYGNAKESCIRAYQKKWGPFNTP